MQNLKKVLFFFIIFFLFNILILFSEEYTNKAIGFSIDLPYQWEIINDQDTDIMSFSSQDRSAVFQIYTFKGNTFNNSEEIFNYIKEKLKANGDRASFIFSGRDSIFSDLTFKSDQFNARGYFVFINGEKFDFALLSYSNSKYYNQNHDFILSILDSFSIDKQGKFFPGPVSQFYYPGDDKNKKKVKLIVEGKTIETVIDYKEIEATKVLIEREARILINFSKYQIELREAIILGNRYYNLIYRDNYSRIKELSSAIIKSFDLDLNNSEEVVKKLVFWIQNFEFKRKEIIDITSPLETLFSSTGDCDSRTLLLLIILHQIGIDAVMLFSPEYQHAAIGINIKGDGARIKYNGRGYLFVNLNNVIEMGRFPEKMTDPIAWIPMKIGY